MSLLLLSRSVPRGVSRSRARALALVLVLREGHHASTSGGSLLSSTSSHPPRFAPLSLVGLGGGFFGFALGACAGGAGRASHHGEETVHALLGLLVLRLLQALDGSSHSVSVEAHAVHQEGQQRGLVGALPLELHLLRRRDLALQKQLARLLVQRRNDLVLTFLQLFLLCLLRLLGLLRRRRLGLFLLFTCCNNGDIFSIAGCCDIGSFTTNNRSSSGSNIRFGDCCCCCCCRWCLFFDGFFLNVGFFGFDVFLANVGGFLRFILRHA
mmetsp:Transcript_6912/g.11517  ORF Transcript_6912/g.11517 Transcript_6912/m.11517 type:complete len:268 (-) Transcript_6912:1036-1839(-)